MKYLNITSKDRRYPEWVSGVAIGVAVFSVPFISYVSPVNLKQIGMSDIKEIFYSLLIILGIIFFLSFVTERLVKKILGKEIPELFPFICFAFYLQFLYGTCIFYIQKLFAVSISGSEIFVLCLFELVCVAFILVGSTRSVFFKRLIMIFAILMMIKALLPLSIYSYQIISRGPSEITYDVEIASPQELTIVERRNIYYVLLDGMMALETASDSGIIDEVEARARVNATGLQYIDKSISSYNTTYLTLASIMLMDHHQKPDFNLYVDQTFFFPSMMLNSSKRLPLISYLKQVNSSFYWSGNSWVPCQTSPSWTCINSSEMLPSRNSFKFFEETPLAYMYKWLYAGLIENQDSIDKFLKFVESNERPKTPYFALIHHLLPHAPYVHTETCETASYLFDDFNGYKASYLCTLRKIKTFMSKINKIDPRAIVVIQADHGWLRPGLSSEEYALYRGKIFNAIKAPQSCMKKFGEPKTNVNTIRLALNCAYGFNFPYRDDVHYKGYYEHESGYGKVVKKQIY